MVPKDEENKASGSSKSLNGDKESEVTQDEIKIASFETAISETKFGKFNYCLFLITIPAQFTSPFEVTSMSYVFPAAQCHLDLSLADKGSLNAITYLGMVSSGFFWGFFSDTLGRKKILVIGFLLDAIFVIMSGLSQSFTWLIITKYFGGFIISGPFASLTAYVSEFHCAKYRSRVQMIAGFTVGFATLVLPLLAWIILPNNININFFNNHLVLHSWNIFLLVCATPSAVSAIICSFMPESPKFLMTEGRNEEALAIFERIFSINTGKRKDEFPIKKLVDETKLERNQGSVHGGHVTANRTKIQALREGGQQIRPLCFPPHIKNLILVCSLQFCNMLSIQTLRLWLPQIFQSISDYHYYNNGTTASLCTMLEIINPSKTSNSTCYFKFSSTVYMNGIIIAAISMVGYVVATLLINKSGKRLLLGILSAAAGICAMLIYFAQNSETVLALAGLALTFGGVCLNTVLIIIIGLFPTTLRSLTISLVMMLGRIGAMTGNFMFPFVLKAGCAPPFFVIGLIIGGSSLLVIPLPNTDFKALE